MPEWQVNNRYQNTQIELQKSLFCIVIWDLKKV